MYEQNESIINENKNMNSLKNYACSRMLTLSKNIISSFSLVTLELFPAVTGYIYYFIDYCCIFIQRSLSLFLHLNYGAICVHVVEIISHETGLLITCHMFPRKSTPSLIQYYCSLSGWYMYTCIHDSDCTSMVVSTV